MAQISCEATADPRTGIGQWVLLTMTGDPNGFGSLDPALVAGLSGFASQPIAPGEIISIFGQLVGPENPVGPQLDGSGRVTPRSPDCRCSSTGSPPRCCWPDIFRTTCRFRTSSPGKRLSKCSWYIAACHRTKSPCH